jgi:diguanylate cyclase (GGDEF)-like protein
MLDIDRFKDFNDRYGHTVGDLILKHVSRTIRSIVREGDMAARYGGEEISFLLFGADRKQAAIDAEAIRKRIEKQPLILRRQTIEITVSIGVSSFPEDASVEEDLIKAADERLYRAKAEGRNRVCAS